MPGYDCKFCSKPGGAILLLTPLTGGDTAGMCEECIPIGTTMLLADSLNIEVEPLYAVVVKESKRQLAAAAKADQAAAEPAATDGQQSKPPAARRRGKAASLAQGGQTPSPGGLADPGSHAATGEADGPQATE